MLSPRDSTQPGKQCSAATFYRRHLAASAAEGNPIGIGTDNRHPFQSGPIQRQGSRILQQHRSLQRRSISDPTALLVIQRERGINSRTIEQSEPDQGRQDMDALLIQLPFMYNSPIQEFAYHFVVQPISLRHLQIESALHASQRRIGRRPVRHDDTVKAPLLPQHIRNQPAVFSRMNPVQRVVTGHHGSHTGFLHGILEHRKIQFAQRALVDHRIGSMTAVLLIVGGKVLDGSDDSVLLHSLDIAAGYRRSQHRILAVILKVSPAERRTVDIDPRTQHDADAPGPGIQGQSTPHFPSQIGIPGRRQRDSARIKGTPRLVPHALRPIGHPNRRNTQSRDRSRMETIDLPRYERSLLLQRHLRNERFGAFPTGLGRNRSQGHLQAPPRSIKSSLFFMDLSTICQFYSTVTASQLCGSSGFSPCNSSQYRGCFSAERALYQKAG